MCGEKTSLDDDKIKEINKELAVSSFPEFLEKFSPVVYSWCDASTGKIQYSTVKARAYSAKLYYRDSLK